MHSLQISFALDRRWHWLRGEMSSSKERDFELLAEILNQHHCPYAVIGGVALQVHQREPRTTLDIGIAVKSYDDLPRTSLQPAGFQETGKHSHSIDWSGPDGTPIQFTDDPALQTAIANVIEITMAKTSLRIINKLDLLREKLRSGQDPHRRRSKRLQDLADVQALIEQDPLLIDKLSFDEKIWLDSLPQ